VMQSVSEAMMPIDFSRPGIYQSTRFLLKKLEHRKKMLGDSEEATSSSYSANPMVKTGTRP
jgi:hypothetical protein